MIEELTMAKIAVTLLSIALVFVFIVLYGQYALWADLRKKGQMRINGWYYAAVKAKEGHYRRWD